MTSVKKIIKKINTKLSEEYPNVILLYVGKADDKIKTSLFYNSNKISNISNNFEMLDGGMKERIIRKTKYLLSEHNIIFINEKNYFIFSI